MNGMITTIFCILLISSYQTDKLNGSTQSVYRHLDFIEL